MIKSFFVGVKGKHWGPVLKWLFIIVSLLIVGSLCAFTPGYILLPLLAYLMVLASLVVKFELGVFIMVFVVLFDPKYTLGICIKSDWNYIINDGYVNNLAIYQPIIIVSFLGFLLVKASKIKEDSINNPLSFQLWTLLAYLLITLSWSYNIGNSLFQLLTLSTNLMIYILIINTIKNDKIHKRIIWCLLSAAVFYSLIVILLYFLPDKKIILDYEITKDILINTNLLGGVLQPDGFIRRGNSLTTPHQTALFMNMVFPLALGLFLMEKSKFKKTLLLFILVLVAAINLVTMTKAALGSLLLMGTFLLAALQRLKKHFIILFFVFIIGVFMILFVESKILKAVASKDLSVSSVRVFTELSQVSNTGGSLSSSTPHFMIQRSKLWKKGFKKLMRTYLAGVGVGNFKYYTRAPHAHSIYFSFLFDFGLIGLGVLLSIIIILCKRFLYMLKFQDTYLQIMCVAFFGGLIAMGIHGLVDFEYNTPVIWLYLGMAVATLNLARQELKSTDISK